MLSPVSDPMTRDERRAGASLAAIFGLRMLGLFLILPVFSVYAPTLAGGDDVLLVGFALGAYGLTQAFFQIPYGMASDRWGRKPVIVAGLLLFAAGGFLAAAADHIGWVIAGRVIQGAGAISAAVTALAADLTREQHRTKVMAMIGATIGLVFALSLVAAPVLYAAIGMPGIFTLTSVLALAAIILLLKAVPSPPAMAVPRRVPFATVLRHPQLARLNFGVLALHMMQTALWVVVPPLLVAVGGLAVTEHWKIYLPAVLLSFVEALQPSLISRIAPPEAKGAALGVYNTTQSIGLFLGGVVGGWLLKHHGAHAVQWFCAALGLTWLVLAATMKPPAHARGKTT